MPLNKKISIIIPTYNRASYISEAIDSVFSQEGKWDLEIIVADDGSTDNTAEVLKKYGSKIKYLKLAHSGKPAVVRNAGVARARGELIAFQDSDDIWAPDKLSKQIPVFDDPKIVLCYANAEIMDSNGKKSGKKIVSDKKLGGGARFETLIKDNVISTLTVVARKDAILAVGGFNEASELKAVEDQELWVKLILQYPAGFAYFSDVLCYYRQHDQNISRADSVQAIQKFLTVYNFIWESKLTANQRDVLESQIFTMHENWSRAAIEQSLRPPISVVMGIYKDQKHVRKAVQSILDQTYRDFELIIVNDGSVDKSADIVKKIKDSRIRFINQTNHGLVYTLNQGVKLARGEFIARMDADDISLPSRFEKELDWISGAANRGLVGTFFAYIDESSSLPTGTVITSPTRDLDIKCNLYFNNPIGHGSTMIRKKAIEEAGGYSDAYGPNEDYDLWRRLAPNWEIGQIPEVLYWYRLSSGGISATKRDEQHRLFAKLITDIWRGPVFAKSTALIIKDTFYYRHLHSSFKKQVYRQYIDQQARLAFEYLIHGRLRSGYKAALALLFISPRRFVRLLPIVGWAPFKRALGRSI